MNGAETYEQSVKRLEEIVKKLESGNLSLEESIALYSEGVRLSQNCKKTLEEAELTVNQFVSTNGS